MGGTALHYRSPRRDDADGNRHVIWLRSWGLMILGHAHPAVVEVGGRWPQPAAWSFGALTPDETQLAGETIGRGSSLPSGYGWLKGARKRPFLR